MATKEAKSSLVQPRAVILSNGCTMFDIKRKGILNIFLTIADKCVCMCL